MNAPIETIQYLINEQGQHTAVVVPITLWQNLTTELGYSADEETAEILADLDLVQAIHSYQEHGHGQGLSSEDVKRSLGL